MSVSRRAAVISSSHEFLVFTRDRDFGDATPYAGIKSDAWSERTEAKVYYASPKRLGALELRRIVTESAPDVIYLNSFFSRFSRSVLMLRRFGALSGIRIVLAPRGEFSSGALSLKSFKKRAYLLFAKSLGLLRGVSWHATSEIEATWIEREFPGAECTHEIEIPPSPAATAPAVKRSGECRFAFLGRVARMKNLGFLVHAMTQLRGSAVLTVFGPLEDAEYWSEVLADVSQLPEGIHVEYAGPVPQTKIVDSLTANHVFVLPTLGENYCHAIAESLSAGVPCLISDRTPWSDIENAGAGWVVPLEDKDRWVQQLQYCIDADEKEFCDVVENVRRYYRARHEATRARVESGEIVPIRTAA